MAAGRTQTNCERVWEEAMESCKEILGEKDFEIVNAVASPEDLATTMKNLESQASQATMSRSLRGIKPHLDKLKIFVTVLWVGIGGRNISAAVLWGATSLLLQLASESEGTLEEICRMLDELGRSLTTFEVSCRTINLDADLLEEFFNLMVDLMLDSVSVIRHLRKADDISTAITLLGWGNVQKKFTSTLKRLQIKVDHLQRLADVQRAVQLSETQALLAEKLSSLDFSAGEKREETADLPCNTLPFQRNPEFHGRDTILEEISNALKHKNNERSTRSVALWGTGGIGKSQIGLEYAHRKVIEGMKAVLWIPSEKAEDISAAFNDAADRLQVPGFDAGKTPSQNQAALFRWLAKTEVEWLIVFDNVEDQSTLQANWPASGYGSILVTCRCEKVATSPAERSLEVLVFVPSEGAQLISKILRRNSVDEDEVSASKDLSEELGGLPMAIVVISKKIFVRKKSVREFIPYYEKNRRTLQKRQKSDINDIYYDKDLEGVWKTAFKDVSPLTGSLLLLLCFFAPDAIPNTLVTLSEDDAANLVPENWNFLYESEELEDAKLELESLSLIRISDTTRLISIHRLIQLGYLDQREQVDRVEAFEVAFCLLRYRFPVRGRGHLYDRWKICGPLVKHVVALQERYTDLRKGGYSFKDSRYIPLMTDACWYLLETHQWKSAERVAEVASDQTDDKNSFNQGEIYQCLASLKVRMGQCSAALELYRKVLSIRRRLVEPDSNQLANALSSMAFTLTAMYQSSEAFEYFKQVFDCVDDKDEETQRKSYNIDRFLQNRGRAYFYTRDFENSKKDFALADRHQDLLHGPRSHYHGETAYMLGKIAAKEDDLSAAHQHFQFAYECMHKGKETHLCIMAVKFQQGCVCLQESDYDEALKHLNTALELCKLNQVHPGDQRELARVQWRMSQVLEKLGLDTKARDEKVWPVP